MSKKFILFLCSVLICILAVSCGDGTTSVETGNSTEEKSGNEADNSKKDDDPSKDSDEDSGEDPEENQEDTEDGNGTGENGSEDQDPDESGDEDSEESWHEEPIAVEPASDSAMKTEALIVTTDEFAEVFQKFADFHTVTGINTKVVTVENICENAVCDDTDPLNDTQKAIKDYVISVEGLRYLVLGGDIEDVPSRSVHDHFELPLGIADYTDDFYSDLYYADFSDWDLNGNGVYAEDEDVPGLIANVAVGRISVSTVEEAELYFSKIVKHHTAFNTAYTTKSLLLANIATEISGVKVNSGYYFETEGKTASIIAPNYSIKRLYTKSTPSPSKEALPLDNESEKAAIEEGMNLIVHSGHGAPSLLTCEQGTDPDRDFSGTMAYNLENETLPFFLSCACEAGQFVKKDSAGEKLMNAPKGGAIVYLGNTTTGLGIAGGSQFIDEMMKNMFAFPYSVIGESYLYAHAAMPQSDTFNPPVLNINVPVVNKDSWTWTKKSIVMLGDPMTIFWRDPVEPFAAEITVETTENEDGKTVSLHFPAEIEGAAIRIFAGGLLYEIPYLMHETVRIHPAQSAETVTVGIKAENSQYFFKEFEL